MSSKLIIVENENEKFTRSKCICEFCGDTHRKVSTFYNNKPKTILQRNMMKVIKELEDKINVNDAVEHFEK